jgi:hypothetical protein
VSLTDQDAQQHVGRHLYDAEHHKIGKIEQIVHTPGGSPDWVSVATGLLGTGKRLAPITDAVVVDDGLAVPFSKDTVEGAPAIEPQGDRLVPDGQHSLHTYYSGRTQPRTRVAEPVDPDRYRVRPHSSEATFGTGVPGPGEPSDVTLQGTGNSAPEETDRPEGSA